MNEAGTDRPAMNRFVGKIALVTGASSGIGRAVAARLAAEGATVACVDVADEGLRAAVAEIGGGATAHRCDVASAPDVDAAVADVVGAHGRLDVVCNIAGIGRFASSHDLAVDEWARIIAVNLTGTFLVCRAALPHVLETKGAIVNTASTAGIMAQPYSAAYCASKGGVVALSKSLAWEYVETGLRVNCVAPGGIETPIMRSFADLPPGADPKLLGKITSPRGFGTTAQIASLFAYAASDEASFMTGAVLVMDGGMTA